MAKVHENAPGWRKVQETVRECTRMDHKAPIPLRSVISGARMAGVRQSAPECEKVQETAPECTRREHRAPIILRSVISGALT